MGNSPLMKAPDNLWGHPVALCWAGGGTARLWLPGVSRQKAASSNERRREGDRAEPGVGGGGGGECVSVVLAAQEGGR